MTARSAGSRGAFARAFTLIEMLIAMVLTLLLVYAIAEFYAYVGETVKDGRALIEMGGQMRAAVQRLKADLDLLTVPVTTWIDDGAGMGYFELAEGLGKDWDANANGLPDNDVVNEKSMYGSLMGDSDDVLAFTVRAKSEPWVGQGVLFDPTTGVLMPDANGDPGVVVGSSNVAEVVWWTSFADSAIVGTVGQWDLDELRFLHRRQLLVRPDLNVQRSDAPVPYYFRVPIGNQNDYYRLMQFCDVSIRFLDRANGHDYYAANSLADLTRRQNRFMHVPGAVAGRFPNHLELLPHKAGNTSLNRADPSNAYSQFRWVLGDVRKGEDVVLSNLLAFDVRVYDPTAPLHADNSDIVPDDSDVTDDATTTIQPGDFGYNTAARNRTLYPIVGYGAYVDLNYNRYFIPQPPPPIPSGAPTPRFADLADPKSQLIRNLAINPQNFFAYYDTWAASYERDGLNQDTNTEGNNQLFDEGTDGLDNDNVFGVDDAGERETAPPYSYPLRGLKVTIRLYEPGTRQVKQATVGADFIAE